MVTGDVRGAGTDANVAITLFGKTGQTSKFNLRNNSRDKSLFERASSDIFHFKTNSVGPLTRVRYSIYPLDFCETATVGYVHLKFLCFRIQHDNTGVGPGWFLDRVSVFLHNYSIIMSV